MVQRGFRRTPSGRIVLRLAGHERALLESLLTQLLELVEPEDPVDSDPLAAMVGIGTDTQAPTDPALARLFPDGYGDQDPEAAADFRRFTERSLREGKVANARTVIDSLGRAGSRLTVPPAEAPAWLAGLNDLRLVLGTRLDVADDPSVTEERIASLARVALGGDEPSGQAADEGARAQAAAELSAYHLYDWLTFLQATLVDAVSGVDLTPPGPRFTE